MIDLFEELRALYKKNMKNKRQGRNLLWLLVIPLATIALLHFLVRIYVRL